MFYLLLNFFSNSGDPRAMENEKKNRRANIQEKGKSKEEEKIKEN